MQRGKEHSSNMVPKCNFDNLYLNVKKSLC